MNKMSSDREEYNRLCSHMSVQPQSQVEHALAKARTTGCLNLSGLTLSVTTCQIIGKLMQTATRLQKLDVSNCMLPAEGAAHIINGLGRSGSVLEADLSSNNLQANTAIKLGAMLRRTLTLKRLFLQWNSMGSIRDSFSILCDGLAANHSLEELDLRNNELQYNAVKDLANSIRKNKSLKILDLRWNSLGPSDDGELLAAVQANSQLTSVQLEGNKYNIHLSMAIEQAAAHNGELLHMAQEWQARCDLLARRSAQLEEREGQRASGVRLLLQSQGHKLSQAARDSQGEMARVEGQLQSSRGRLDTLEALVRDKDAQLDTLQEMNLLLKSDAEKDRESLREQLVALREQLESSQRLTQTLQASVDSQQAENERLASEKAELQNSLVLHNDKCADVVRAAEARAMQAVDRAKKEYFAAEEKIRQERSQVEERLMGLEKARSHLEARVTAEREAHGQALKAVREQAEQLQEERVTMLQATMAALMTEKSTLAADLETRRQEVEGLKQELARQKESHSLLQSELLEERSRVQRLTAQLTESVTRREDVSRLERQLEQVQQQLNSMREERDRQVGHLTELVATQERHVTALRTDEAERAGLLCSAVTQYLTRTSAALATLHS